MTTRHLFELPTPALPVIGEDALYPVRRIFCVARNYAGHAREMGQDPDREPPFYFTKAAHALVPGGGPVTYAPATADLHHELELVVALGAPLFQATPDQAARALFGYGVGLDLTRRDVQAELKAKGRPWDLAKSFEQSAPISALRRAQGVLSKGSITLEINGEPRQTGDLDEMIWPIPELLANLSRYYTLGPGDLVFTGTPEGVGPVRPGDRLIGRVEGVGELDVTILPR